LDGHFGNHNALHMARQHHLHLISKLRCDAALVTVQVVTTGITPQLATSERLREAETEPRHHGGPRHTPR